MVRKKLPGKKFLHVMEEWKEGKLYTGRGRHKVTSQKQAEAIAFSEQRKEDSKHKGKYKSIYKL